MAQIIYRVMGTENSRRVSFRFRNTDEGRTAAKAAANRLKDAKTVYDPAPGLTEGCH